MVATLERTLVPALERPGQRLDALISQAVWIDGRVAVPKGAMVEGEIGDAGKRGDADSAGRADGGGKEHGTAPYRSGRARILRVLQFHTLMLPSQAPLSIDVTPVMVRDRLPAGQKVVIRIRKPIQVPRAA